MLAQEQEHIRLVTATYPRAELTHALFTPLHSGIVLKPNPSQDLQERSIQALFYLQQYVNDDHFAMAMKILQTPSPESCAPLAHHGVQQDQ